MFPWAPAGAQGQNYYEPPTYPVSCPAPCFIAPAAMEAGQTAQITARIHNAGSRTIPNQYLNPYRGTLPFDGNGDPSATTGASPFTDASSWSGNLVGGYSSTLPPQHTAEVVFSVHAPDITDERAYPGGLLLPALLIKTWNAVWVASSRRRRRRVAGSDGDDRRRDAAARGRAGERRGRGRARVVRG